MITTAAKKPERRMMLKSVKRGVIKTADKILIHGVPGVGKSTFATGFPAPVVAETDDDGTAKLDTSRVTVKSWADLLDFVEELTTVDHEFKTFVLDTADAAEALLWRYICDRDEKKSIEEYGYGKGYVAALDDWRGFLAALERLRAAKGMGVVILAHTNVNPFKNPEGDDYDRYEMKLHKRASALLQEWCDAVLFARFEVLVATDEKRRARAVSTGNRVLHTVRTGAYDAKNRYGLPDTIPLDYASFAAACAVGTPRDVNTVKAAIAAYLERLPDLAEKVQPLVSEAGIDPGKLIVIENRLLATLAQRQKESK